MFSLNQKIMHILSMFLSGRKTPDSSDSEALSTGNAVDSSAIPGVPTQEESEDIDLEGFVGIVRRLYGRYLPPYSSALHSRWQYLTACGKILCPEYRFKWPQLDWWQNQRFSTYLKHIGEEDGFNSDRRWMLGQLLRLTQAVSGDVAECGTYNGGGAYLLLRWCKEEKKKLYIFDSFEGLSEPDAKHDDAEYWHRGSLNANEDTVKRTLAELDAEDVYKLYKGWIPERFKEVEERRFSFVHIDVDLYQPTRDSIRFFYPRVNPGGIIVCDDYGSGLCPGATEAIDLYLRDKPEKMIAQSGGAGFLIKGCATASQI